MRIKIFQIGVGSFGRYGFEKLVRMSRKFEDVDVEIEAVCDTDFERLEKAEKFAEANGIDIQTFQDPEEMYEEAEKHEKVMIYDSGPTETHPEHVMKSIRHGFFHLAEKPASLTRDQHLEEKRLAENERVMWKTDFIERESPVIKKMTDLVREVDEIRTYRESSVGVEKALEPMKRAGVKGGDVLDKMVHKAYILDFLEKTPGETEMELEKVETDHLMPAKMNSDRLMSIHGGRTENIDEETATAVTQAEFNSSDMKVKMHSSWFGLSQELLMEAKRIEEKTGHRPFERGFSHLEGTAYVDEEARLVVIEGDKNLAGDLLHNKLFDLDTGEEIETEYFMHDQLWRVLEKAILEAVGDKEPEEVEKETDIFMEAIFNIKENIGGDYMEEVEKANDKLKSMVVDDGKLIEAEGSETLAG
ncbi:MAG: Gfo/Idh/MocA family oxidoreductase [Nanohaloarchaea archaeon]|nr:Gfo/Idh/MocA family oxidoreductase [Candidatus Nanohaloarchaea archaeon]